MKEFRLILSGSTGSPLWGAMPANDHPDEPALILDGLHQSLAALDRAGAGIAAAHLAMAIDSLNVQFNLAENMSGMD